MQSEALASGATQSTADKEKGAGATIVVAPSAGPAVALDGVSLFDMAKPIQIPQEELDKLWKWNVGLAIWHVLYVL